MYFKTDEKLIDYQNEGLVNNYYANGYLFGRIQPGFIYQTRSLRLDLNQFSPNSENRRILNKFKTEEVKFEQIELPIVNRYNWEIHKLGKDFYSSKFPDEDFSASKIKDLVTQPNHFNTLLSYRSELKQIGYAISYQSSSSLHYCYPFYDLTIPINNLGMYMMLQAILWAQMHGKKYCYLGGATRAADKYKLQFSGLEWWQGSAWNKDISQLKEILANS
jgi:arginyl-tRNA--protein-N-Asp/Glu arginylyltransferase